MAAKDYYLILGIGREATPDTIREAYRRKAREHHPDVAGTDSTGLFQDISEAYGVLSDPRARRRYDATLERRIERAQNPEVRRRTVVPIWPDPVRDEVSTRSPRAHRRHPLGSWEPGLSMTSGSPGADLPRPRPDFGVPAAVDLEIFLRPVEARRGARLSVPIPSSTSSLLVPIPPDVRDGDVLELSLPDRRRTLRILIRIA